MVQVTYEAVKRQLELLGHDVPDDAIRAYLADLQKGASEDSGPGRAVSHTSGRSEHITRTNISRRHDTSKEDSGIDDLCNRFQDAVRPGRSAAMPAESHHPVSAEHDRWSERSNPRATDPLFSEEVMTRAQNILDEHHNSRNCVVPRHHVPASDRVRSHLQTHISGTLEPRVSMLPEVDAPPVSIAPQRVASRLNGARLDTNAGHASTDRAYRRSPHASVHGFSHHHEPSGDRPGDYSRNAWTGDASDSDCQHAGDSADDLHDRDTLESPGKYRGHSGVKHMHKHAHRRPKTKPQKDLLTNSSSDEGDYEGFRNRSPAEDADYRPQTLAKYETDAGRHKKGTHRAVTSRVRDGAAGSARGSTHEGRIRSKYDIRQRDLSPFDANVEDNDREWENVLLEATGGAQVGHQTGSRTSGPGERTGVYGDAWGLREDWGDRRTERGYSQVHQPHQRLRTPLTANNSYIVGRSNLSGVARPIDRVARYQQLKKGWSKDKFLNKSKGQVLGYKEAFERCHRREKVDLQHLKDTNRPATTSSTSRAYVPPGQKRRDKLRWNVRQRMQWQD